MTARPMADQPNLAPHPRPGGRYGGQFHQDNWHPDSRPDPVAIRADTPTHPGKVPQP